MKKYSFLVLFLVVVTFTFAQKEKECEGGNPLVTGHIDNDNYLTLEYWEVVPENSLSFNAGYGIPLINNALTKADFWNKKMGTALSFGIDYKYQFQKITYEGFDKIKNPTLFGLGIGLGISYLTQSEFMNNHTESLNSFTDTDGDLCNVSLSYSGIKEKVSLTCLDIPLYLEIGKPSQVKISGYFNVGVKASLLLSGKFSGEGTYTSLGYYPATGVTLHGYSDNRGGIPELGYYSDKSAYEEPEYKLSRFVLWGSLSGGINIPFSKLEKNHLSDCIIRIGARIDYTFLPISKAVSEPYFTNATYRINQSNMLGGIGSRVLIFGLDIKFIYCL
jgi:hypothetical protein